MGSGSLSAKIGAFVWRLVAILLPTALLMAACGGGAAGVHAASPAPPATPSAAWRAPLKVSYQGVSVDVVIDKPAGTAFDVLLVYHGTVMQDALVMQAAQKTLEEFRGLLDDPTVMVVSVAYPEENLLIGDNLASAEAALLWVKHQAASELGLQIRHVFLGGHSQGGYLVTRLNTLHPTRGVIANAPGPIDLVHRCRLEEEGTIASGEHCTRLRQAYGTTTANPAAYTARSLGSFTTGYQSDILFAQGLEDSRLVQMAVWPAFKQQVQACTSCRDVQVLELPGFGHSALFNSTQARDTYRAFLNARR
jgi:pimeloyl-ACP methyl ester carboxylesterase